MMHFNKLRLAELDEIKPQSNQLLKKLQDEGLFVRHYAGSHYNLYLIASLLHWELGYLDEGNLRPWLERFPGLVDFANLYAKDNGLRHIDNGDSQ